MTWLDEPIHQCDRPEPLVENFLRRWKCDVCGQVWRLNGNWLFRMWVTEDNYQKERRQYDK